MYNSNSCMGLENNEVFYVITESACLVEYIFDC